MANGGTMTWQQRFKWAALGGAALVLVNIWAIDAKTMFLNVHLDRVFAGYVVSSISLIVLAGIFGGIIYAQETSIPKLIQMGVSVPAILTQLLTGANGVRQNAYHFQIDNVAYASELKSEERPDSRVKDFTKIAEELNSFISGLTHSTAQNTFFLVIHETDDREKALEFADRMEYDLAGKEMLTAEEGKPKLSVSVYLPFKSLKWSVVIGERLSHEEADELVKKLLLQDFKGVRVWDLATEKYVDEKGE